MTSGRKRILQAPDIKAIWLDYCRLGTFVAEDQHRPLFEGFLRRTEIAQLDNKLPRAAATNYKNTLQAMLHYELGIASQETRPDEAFLHYVISERLFGMPYHNQSSVANKIHYEHFRSITSLLRARLDLNERQHRLNLNATIRKLGELVVEGSSVVPEINDRDEQGEIFGALSEVAMAATLLLPGETERQFIPARTTIRQDSPHKERPQGYRGFIANGEKTDAFDITLLEYRNHDRYLRRITPTQVKYREKTNDKDRYVPSILMLYSDRDLFCESITETQTFGKLLIDYGQNGEMSRTLAVARSNIDLAYDIHHQSIEA